MSFSRSSVFYSMIWKFLERCSVQFVSFIVSIVLARILCPEEFGLVALVFVFVNISNVIVEGGLNTALIQKKDADKLDFSTIFYTSIILAFVLYVLLFFSAQFIAAYYNKPVLLPVVRVLGLSLFFYAINSVQKAYLSKKLLFKKLFFSSIGAVLLSGLIGIIMAIKGYGIWALVTQSIVSQLVTTVVMWFTVKWRPTLEFSFSRFKELFNYGWKILATNFIISLFVNVRSLIIGKMYSASSLAYFDRGKHFPSLIVENINSSIQAVLFPVLSSEQDNIISIKSMVRRSIKISTFVIFPLTVGLAAISEPLVRVLLTDKWLECVPFIWVFCAAYLLMPMQIANMEAIKSLGYSGITLKIEIIKKILELLILLITIPISPIAIAIGIVVYNLISLIINTWPNKRLLNYGFKEQVVDALPALGLALITGAVVRFIQIFNLPLITVLVLQIIIGVLIYLCMSWIFKIESLNYLLQIVKNKKK